MFINSNRTVALACSLMSVVATGCLNGSTPDVGATGDAVIVTAATISALPKDTQYVVDVTKPDNVYEFDAANGALDYSRVTLHASWGDVRMSDWLVEAGKDPAAEARFRLEADAVHATHGVVTESTQCCVQVCDPTPSGFQCYSICGSCGSVGGGGHTLM